jgi:hypothetical protein
LGDGSHRPLRQPIVGLPDIDLIICRRRCRSGQENARGQQQPTKLEKI